MSKKQAFNCHVMKCLFAGASALSLATFVAINGASQVLAADPKVPHPVVQPEAAKASSEPVDAPLRAAEKALSECKPAEAMREVNRGLALYPKQYALYVAKANIEIFECQYAKAIEDSNRAIALKPMVRFAYAARAEALMRLGHYDKAQADYTKAASLTLPERYSACLDELKDLRYDSQHAVADPAKQWALACTGFLFCQNREALRSLPGEDMSDKNQADKRKSLSEWWGIENRQDLLSTIKLTLNGCHNPRWLEIRRAIQNGEDLSKYKSRWTEQKEFDTAISLVKAHGEEYGDRGILAWDLARSIALCRWGYLCGYITEAEAWQLMMPAALMMQKNYKSWDQMSAEYLVGRQFWSDSIYREGEFKLLRIRHRLLHDPASPWVKLAWNTPLNSIGNKSVGSGGAAGSTGGASEFVKFVDEKLNIGSKSKPK